MKRNYQQGGYVLEMQQYIDIVSCIVSIQSQTVSIAYRDILTYRGLF